MECVGVTWIDTSMEMDGGNTDNIFWMSILGAWVVVSLVFMYLYFLV